MTDQPQMEMESVPSRYLVNPSYLHEPVEGLVCSDACVVLAEAYDRDTQALRQHIATLTARLDQVIVIMLDVLHDVETTEPEKPDEDTLAKIRQWLAAEPPLEGE